MSRDKNIPNGFIHPTILPKSAEEAQEWQKINRSWWENSPMRYDWKKKIPYEEFTREFYQEIDLRFFSIVKDFMPWIKVPFDPLIDFESLSRKDVLEIGVGNGSHAQLLAQHARSFSGIDLTEYAVKSTSQRMQCFNLKANIIRMDAERMAFEDNSFDFVWSWGVIHHSANTRKILEEMHRVLRPNGQAVIMVYHRTFWNYYIIGGLILGILCLDFLRSKSLCKTVQRYTDGGIARYYTISEWKSLVSDLFLPDKTVIFGSKADIIPLPEGKLQELIIKAIPNPIGRFLTNKLRMGNFLVSILKKR